VEEADIAEEVFDDDSNDDDNLEESFNDED